MRKHMVLAALVLALSLLIGIQLVTTQVRGNVIQADVNIDPDSLLLTEDGHGKWITAYIGLPENYDVNNINVSSVSLEVMGILVSKSKHDIQANVLMVKFDRTEVISILWSMVEHMSPHVKQEVTLKVTGTLVSGEPFGGSDTIRVFFTHPQSSMYKENYQF